MFGTAFWLSFWKNWIIFDYFSKNLMSLLISPILLIYGRTWSDFDFTKLGHFTNFTNIFVESLSISCKFVIGRLETSIEQGDDDLHKDKFFFRLLLV